MRPKLIQSEGDLKQAVQNRLQLERNAGRLHWDRLNAGELITSYQDKAGKERKYKVQLCEPGTWDMYILARGKLVFLETKSTTGKLRPDQIAFQARVQALGAEFWLIRDLEDLERRLGELLA